MELSKAISKRLSQLLTERKWSSYKLSGQSAVPTSTISNIMNCNGDSCTVLTLYNICRGLQILPDVFFSPDIFGFENINDD